MDKSSLCLLLLLLSVGSVVDASAAPGAATLVAPAGDVSGTTITFSWNSVPEATWYLLWLGKGSPTAFVLEQWYTAEQAGCANGGTCTVSMTPPLDVGQYTWFIETWAAGVTGPWSAGKVFFFKGTLQNWATKLPVAQRFTVVLEGQAVLDNETGIVWERGPLEAVAVWNPDVCVNRLRAGRAGWRLASVTEMMSLYDLNTGGFPTPSPFSTGSVGVTPDFWTSTTTASSTSGAWSVAITNMQASAGAKNSSLRSWCVRSANAP